ncbi:type II toxin-antitoxin system VapC family toxin [Caldinitratiruptor microaerophilus]|uniref:DNA-binding protein n=1 Tax=Caldinitratiruptor microaerophilus TaxID=671077 RepID=A0AA35CM43_9FIRM|nr:type II toxin-antitoxin system VapC family toxin [Caldinitratiruptor microaerophilus]BDG59815.1 DNA-binding protein [Caldinitratiruptor microaerophilus]
MKTAVDTNVLLDVLTDDPRFAEASLQALRDALRLGSVVICPVVHAELAAFFDRADVLETFLRDLTIRLDPFDVRSLYAAGRTWKTYTRARGQQVQCAQCGQAFTPECPACGRAVAWRQHLMPDFLVGAHATVQADALLTRDRGYYRSHFPSLKLIVPGAK